MANSNSTWVQRVVTLIKGGDEAKILRFHGKLLKFTAKQKATIASKIENLSDRITDKKEQLEDALVSISMDNIKTTEAANAYTETFLKNVTRVQREIEALEQEKEDLAKQIDNYEQFEALVK